MKYALDNPRDLSTVHAPVISALITRLFSMNTETEITEMMFVRRLFIYYALARWYQSYHILSIQKSRFQQCSYTNELHKVQLRRCLAYI